MSSPGWSVLVNVMDLKLCDGLTYFCIAEPAHTWALTAQNTIFAFASGKQRENWKESRHDCDFGSKLSSCQSTLVYARIIALDYDQYAGHMFTGYYCEVEKGKSASCFHNYQLIPFYDLLVNAKNDNCISPQLREIWPINLSQSKEMKLCFRVRTIKELK